MKNDSVLQSVKKGLGIPLEDDGFDQELIIHINTALMILTQLGVGPDEGVFITSQEDTWASIIEGALDLEMVKTYVILRVKLIFDPPTSSFVLESIKNQLAEFEWRLNVQVEGAFDV